ncbi:MAG: integrase core domain-containing protein [Pirellulaceae bacterium]
MRNIYRSLLLLLAGATQKELARHVRYLKVENQILRSKLPKRVQVTAQERNRLTRFAAKLGGALDELVSIVHPDTVRRWIREAKQHGQPKSSKLGRRPTALAIRRLIVRLARENGWGYTRILGELKKLGLRRPARNTVKNILKANGYDPGPKRGVGTWDEFLKIHAATLWQCDFFSKKVLTPKGFRDLFVLVFLHVETRRVFITPSSFKPDEAWMVEQAEAFRKHLKETGLGAKIVMHDNDGKFSQPFNDALEADGKLEVRKTAIRSPNTVAFVERFVQTIQQECLDYFIVFGQQHMDYLCREFGEHYHEERPHQGLDNDLLATVPKQKRKSKRKQREPEELETIPLSSVRCKQRLGGLLKHYYRDAA